MPSMGEAVSRTVAWPAARPRAIRAETVAILAASLATIVVQCLVRLGTQQAATLDIVPFYGVAIAQCVFGLAFASVRYAELGPFLTALTRGCSLGLAFFLLVEPTDITLTLGDSAWRFSALNGLYYPAVAFAILGCLRPSFILFPACYVITVRYAMAGITGFQGATLDIRYLVEMAQYLSLTTVALVVWKRNAGPGTKWMLERDALKYCLGFNAIAFHFGNYFWAGIAKVGAGPSVLSWSLENATENVILQAMEKGTFIFAQWPAVTEAIYQSYAAVRPFANAFVVLTQLFAVVAILRRRWTILASIAYDALHVGLYLLQGLFFWPWVWINVVVLQAMRRLPDDAVPPVARVSSVLVMTLCGFAGLMQFSWLAWFESNTFRLPFVEVQAPGGDWIRVPNSFFGTDSYSVSHGKIDVGVRAGQYTPSAWGGLPYEEFKRREGCQDPAGLPVANAETPAERARREMLATRFLQARHREVLTRVDGEGRYNPYLRFHHHPSNPLLYGAFNQLDLRQVRNYRVVTQSVCLGLRDGRLQRRVMSEDDLVIDVAP